MSFDNVCRVRVGLVMEQPLAPIPGGTGRYSLELAAALARTAGAGDSIHSWTSWHRDVSAARVAGVDGPRRLPLGRRVLTVSWERGLGPGPRDVDVVHAPTPLFPPRHRPLVVSINDTVPWTHPHTLTAHGAKWHRAMAARAARVADAITVLTEAVAVELAEVLPGLDGRVHVLGAGVTRSLTSEPSPERVAEVARRLGLPDVYLLSLATLEPRKGLDVLVKALGEVPGDVPLFVAGQPGWGQLDLAGAAREAGVSDERIRVLGRIGDADLGVVLRKATLLVVPSRAEGFGLPAVEAMAVGTPVVCSDAPALVEVTGGAAAIVPRGDSTRLAETLVDLLADVAQRKRMAQAGLARAAQFDWDEVARRAWALYRQLCLARTR